MEQGEGVAEEDIWNEQVDVLQQSMVDLMTHAGCMSVGKLCALLSLKESNVCNVYVMGSRMWGSAKDDSDWDVIIILRNASIGKQSVHKANVDAMLLTVKEYQQRLVKHEVLLLMTVFGLPSHCILKQSLSTTDLVQLHRTLLWKSVDEEMNRDWQLVEKKFRKRQWDAGKRVLVAALRLLVVSRQLARYGRVVNVYAAHTYYVELRNDFAKDWQHYHALWQPRFNTLRQRVQELCQ